MQDQNQMEEDGYSDGDLKFDPEAGYIEMSSLDLFKERSFFLFCFVFLNKKGQIFKIMVVPKEP